MKKLVLLLLTSMAVYAQTSLNDYNIALIPSRFDFQKQADQHKINSHLKKFLQKYGFAAYLDSDVIPAEVAALPCNKLYGNVVDNSNLFMTKVRVELRDCSNHVVFTSDEGSSREKDFEKAYLQALRGAFASFERTYKFSGGKGSDKTLPTAPDKQKTDVQRAGEKEAGTAAAAAKEVKPMQMLVKKRDNGYEITDLSGAHVMNLYRTSNPDVFIAQSGTTAGAFVRVGTEWRWEFYEKGNFMSVTMPVTLQ